MFEDARLCCVSVQQMAKFGTAAANWQRARLPLGAAVGSARSQDMGIEVNIDGGGIIVVVSRKWSPRWLVKSMANVR